MPAAPLPAALVAGPVMHQRLKPLRHRLRYRVFSLLVDLDELPVLHARLRCWSLDRFNLFSLRQADHGPPGDGGLRERIDRLLGDAGFARGGPVQLLTMPRVLGYAFNPLSVYFCHAPGGGLQALLYEVNNTFGERHHYLIGVPAQDADATLIEQRCDKHMHVSPFLPMDMHYRFRIRPPAADGTRGLSIGVDVHDADGLVLAARYDATPRPLADRALVAALFTHPLLTLKVIAGIHWEALRLWTKGARVHRQPATPAPPLTIVPPLPRP